MSDQRDGGIAWCDETWNPIRGCSRVSPGCENCYAERVAARFSKPGQAYEGLAVMGENGPRWTREVRMVPEHLADPLRWKRPRRVFVNSMSDLFHEKLTNEQIAAVFGVMAAAPRHTFQVLTKRPERMVEWFSLPGIAALVDTLKHVALAGRVEEYVAPERIVDVPFWSGYFVTSKGRVLSDRDKHGGRTAERHEVQPLADGEGGHQRVMLYPGGTRVLVHRLMLDVFARPARDGEQACHIDGDPANNALWNLRWGSQSSNWDDSKRHGTARRHQKLSDEQVVELRSRAAAGETGAALGRAFGISDTQARNIISGRHWPQPSAPAWPLPSVWLGVTAEDQQRANERIPLLMQTPAVIRFVSVEPQLGPVQLMPFTLGAGTYCHDCGGAGVRIDEDGCCATCGADAAWFGVDWVITGAESGPGARPYELDWARSLRAQCAAAGAAFFLKQIIVDGKKVSTPALDGVVHAEFPR